MNVSLLAKESAVIAIYRGNGVTHQNGRLLFSDITEEWTATGMRATDLFDGLESFLESGVLIQDMYQGTRGLTLTALGANYLATTTLEFGDVPEKAAIILTLGRARQRERTADSENLRRRAEDQADEANLLALDPPNPDSKRSFAPARPPV